MNWRTARKYAHRDDWNEKKPDRAVTHRVLGPFLEVIDQWLEEDERMPAKQRHTARRVFQRLTEEHAYEGCDRSVRSYVSRRRMELKLQRAQCYERLEHPGGEAQVDFGKSMVLRNDRFEEVSVLHVTFPCSNARFVYPMPAENQECFLEGLRKLFEFMGGVPKKIWIDNLAAAVVSNRQNRERVLNDGFTRFMCHYRFETVLCNPGAGNEKGSVENSVGTERRGHLSPPPRFEGDWLALGSDLLAGCIKDLDKAHYSKERPVIQLWNEERGKLLILPEIPYDVFRAENRIVNKYGEFKIDETVYRAPGVRPGDNLLIKVRWDQLDIIGADHKLIATVERAYSPKTVVIDWADALRPLVRKPRAVAYSNIVSSMPTALAAYLKQWNVTNDIQEALDMVVELLEQGYSPSSISNALELMTLEPGCKAEPAGVRAGLSYLTAPQGMPPPFEESHTPDAVKTHTPNLERYNQLTGGMAEV